MKNKNIFLLILIIILSVSCTKKEKFDPAQITIGLEGSPSIFDPRLATDAYSSRINALLYNGLVKVDENSDIKPDIAKSWAVKDKSIIFTLRKNVKFYSGKELTAEDVKYTLESVFKMPSPFKNSLKEIEKITILDKYNIKIDLKKIFAPIFTALTIGIVPKDSGDLSLSPKGTGPYKLEKFIRGNKVILTVNNNFFKKQPHIKKIIFKIIPNDTTRVMEIKKGSIDFLQNSVPPDALEELKKDKTLTVIIKDGVNVSYLGFNLQDPILKNSEVRKAIAYSINKKEIIDYMMKGLASDANSIIAQNNWAYWNEKKYYDFNPEKAKQILDKAGFVDPDGDGPQPRFTLEFKTSTNKVRKRIAEVIASQLKKVGINLTVRSYEFGTFFADIKAGNFQLYSLTWVGIIDPDILYYVFSSKSLPPQGANRGHYINNEVDKLLEASRQTMDMQKRINIYKKVQNILFNELPVYPLWYHKNIVVYKKDLKNFKILPGGEYTSLESAYREPAKLIINK